LTIGSAFLEIMVTGVAAAADLRALNAGRCALAFPH